MPKILLKLWRRRQLERDLEQELNFHREMSAANGNPIPFGNTSLIKEQAFDLWRFTWFENLWRDLQYAARGLKRSPGFVLSAILSLGLGIGVNTTIFSLAVEFLLSEPSVSDSSNVVYVRLGGNSHVEPKVLEFIRTSGFFAGVAGENSETFINWNDGVETRRIFSVQASQSYFEALGVPVALGRGWSSQDHTDVVVLRHQFWKRHYNGDPAILGRTIQLDGRAYSVIGVLPETHRTLLGYGFSPDVYVPRFQEDTVQAVYARLMPGMTLAEAHSGVRVLGERIDVAFPSRWKAANNIRVTPISGFARLQQDQEVLAIGLFFAALLIVAGLVLLIACVNVAGLLLARSAARHQELSVRMSLGASRARLFQQLLAESMVLAGIGCAVGFAFAFASARLLAAISLPLPIPIQLQVEPDWRVAAYAALLAVLSAAVSGFAPAWQALRESAKSLISQQHRKLRLRRTLVVVQVAVSFVVLATGALFLQNLMRSTAMSPGFDVTSTVRAEVHLPPGAYTDASRINAYVARALPELRSLPGIETAAAARIIPFTDATTLGTDITFADNGEKQRVRYNWNAVSPSFFRAMSIPIMEGREFQSGDLPGGARVVVVNTAFVKQFLGGRRAVGTVFKFGDGRGGEAFEIVGVAAVTKNLTLGEDEQPQLYDALSQIENKRPRLQFVLRSATPPTSQLAAVRQVLRRVEPGAGLEVATMFSSIGLAFLPSQIGAVLMGSIGALGLLLAAIGLGGVLAYSVEQRVREIGVRVALGASSGHLTRMVLYDAARMVLGGSILGIGIALVVTRPLSMFLVPGLRPSDPWSLTAVAISLAITGILAAAGPVRRALKLDPMTCLRIG